MELELALFSAFHFHFRTGWLRAHCPNIYTVPEGYSCENTIIEVKELKFTEQVRCYNTSEEICNMVIWYNKLYDFGCWVSIMSIYNIRPGVLLYFFSQVHSTVFEDKEEQRCDTHFKKVCWYVSSTKTSTGYLLVEYILFLNSTSQYSKNSIQQFLNLLFLSIFRFRSEIGIIKSRFFCTTYQSFLLNLSSKDISTKNRCPVKWYVIWYKFKL